MQKVTSQKNSYSITTEAKIEV